MPQNAEAQSFLSRIAQLPPGPGAAEKLSDVLQPSLDDEAELRKFFAQEKTHSRLADKCVGLVDVFDAPASIRTTRARVVKDDADLSAKFIMPLAAERRRKEGEPAMVPTLDEFKKNWAIFSEGSLSQLIDWSNVIVSGGAVLACLNPVPESAKVSKRALRKHYHNHSYPTSDVDLFLYGLTPEQAEKKIIQIYEAVRDSVPWDVTCIRTKHAVSIHSQYPYRAVQIVLRLYSSPGEILAGFDVDAPCCAYDGSRVWASPRAIVAMMRQCNTVDVTRRSPSYEVRLSKYSERDFEIYVPALKREDIDPTIYERSILRIQGLARLLVLEKLKNPDARTKYLTSRRDLRGRPRNNEHRRSKLRKGYKGDLKANADAGLEQSGYDVVSLHIPYGPGWDARRIEKLVYQTDLSMNSSYNPKNKDRRLHRHSAFFGTVEECIEDCCEYCIEPKNKEEKALQEEEDQSYVRGRISFVQEDPGRQSISGSFNPIDDGEWAEQAYMGPVEKLFYAIAQGNRDLVAKIIKQEDTDLNRRDHVGRTALQLAVMCKHADIAYDLIDADARMTSRIADGRTVLHLAAQLDLPHVVRKLLARSDVNAEKVMEEEKRKELEEKEEAEKSEEKMDVDENEEDDEDDEHNSSEDDWISEDGDKKKPAKKSTEPAAADNGQIPEDEEDEPDVLDVNAPDWDLGFTPLQYAIATGSLSVIDDLIAACADVKLVTKAPNQSQAIHQLTTVLLAEDEEKAALIATKLFAAGAVSSEADEDLTTILHHVINSDRPRLLSAFLRSDPSAKAVVDTPHVNADGQTQTPLVSAVEHGNYANLAVLLAFNAKVELPEEEWHQAQEARRVRTSWRKHTYRSECIMPLEVALSKRDSIAYLLVTLGADVNAPTIQSQIYEHNATYHYTLLDWVRRAQLAVTQKLVETYEIPSDFGLEGTSSWKAALAEVLRLMWKDANRWAIATHRLDDQGKRRVEQARDYYKAMEDLLVSHGAKTWDELYPEKKDSNPAESYLLPHRPKHFGNQTDSTPQFYRATANTTWQKMSVPDFQVAAYEELFEACWNGDNDTIRRLCLPKEEGSVRQSPLQIVAWFSDAYVTPLSIAVQRRHWATARLILAIAHAQHQTEEPEPSKFSIRDIALDEESASEDEDEDEDMEEEEKPIFRDIAKLPSTLLTPATPQLLLRDIEVYEPNKEGESVHSGSLLNRAVVRDDFETFTQILDMHKELPTPVAIPLEILYTILAADQPDMLDEYIRRTGMGIEVAAAAEEAETQERWNPNPKVYLGLNVHGKKRRDLASKGDPNAPVLQVTSHKPLVWLAARVGAIKVLKYLSGDRPLAAYQYYGRTRSDERAIVLRRRTDLADILPRWLGWSRNNLNESAVTAAVFNNKLEAIKALIELSPTEMAAAMTANLKYTELNHLLLGALTRCSADLFDYLLGRGVSPSARDHRGWNILHILCAQSKSKEQVALLKHILRVLPQDLLQQLSRQASKGGRNTPLHLAVSYRRVDLVDLLLTIGSPPTVFRNTQGATPLHCAVRNAQPEITRLLIQTGPVEALFMEDAAGQTPLEFASRNVLQSLVLGVGSLPPRFRAGSLLQQDDFSHIIDKQPVPELLPQGLDVEVTRFRATLEELIQLSRLRTGTKLTTELLAFADRMERQLAERVEESKEMDPKSEQDPDEPREDSNNAHDVLRTISKAIAAYADHTRHLVHLSDVLESVKRSMDTSAREVVQNRKRETAADEAGLAEEVMEDNEKNNSILKMWLSHHCPDPFNDDIF